MKIRFNTQGFIKDMPFGILRFVDKTCIWIPFYKLPTRIYCGGVRRLNIWIYP